MSDHPRTGAPAGPTAPGPVRAVGVLVPARDERDHIEACLHAVLDALGELPPDIATALCVVVDRSRDGTATLVRRMLAAGAGVRRPVVDVVPNGHAVTIGDLRNLGAARLLRRLGAVAPDRTWLLSTDADSTVPPDWALAHLRRAGAGADAVAGGVELDGPGLLDDPVPTDAAPGRPPPDPPLYAANLGVRGAPFLAAGGFPPVRSGEEHALVDRLRRAGYRVVAGADVTVRTSARTRGRAVGGLADLLSERAAAPTELATGVPRHEGG